LVVTFVILRIHSDKLKPWLQVVHSDLRFQSIRFPKKTSAVRFDRDVVASLRSALVFYVGAFT